MKAGGLTIDEAITHAEQVADRCPGEDRQCAYQHDQLADWLRELKAYKASGLTAEQRMHVCNGLEEDLNRIAAREQGVGECVGIAIGLEYMYLDCVCYDWDAFLEIAAQLLQSYGALYQIQTGGFSQLYKGGQTIKLL